MISVGFIGTGNMGGALAKAVAKAGAGCGAAGGCGEEYKILLANRSTEKAEKLAAELKAELGADAEAVSDNAEIAGKADFIFLGVKPQMMADMLKGIAPLLAARSARGEKFTLITMAAGLGIDRIKEMAEIGRAHV